MGYMLMGLGGLCGLVGFICLIMVIVKMFQNDQSTMGIITIVCIFCGVGYLVGLIIGWMNAAAWKIKNMMIVYTVCLVLSPVLYFAGAGLLVGQAIQEMPEGEIQFNTDF